MWMYDNIPTNPYLLSPSEEPKWKQNIGVTFRKLENLIQNPSEISNNANN